MGPLPICQPASQPVPSDSLKKIGVFIVLQLLISCWKLQLLQHFNPFLCFICCCCCCWQLSELNNIFLLFQSMNNNYNSQAVSQAAMTTWDDVYNNYQQWQHQQQLRKNINSSNCRWSFFCGSPILCGVVKSTPQNFFPITIFSIPLKMNNITCFAKGNIGNGFDVILLFLLQ